jgi:signal peptidase I
VNRLIPRPQSGVGSFLELIVIVLLAVGLAWTIQAFVVKPYRIPSPSMEPTLDIGQRVLVNRVNYHLSDPDPGNIVVFHPPTGADTGQCGDPHTGEGHAAACDRGRPGESSTTFIKRIVAGPGDRLRIVDGHPVVNGVEPKEDFIRPCIPGRASVPCNMREEITIPPDHYFMMGDNRGASDDSRIWGPVPRSSIIGQAFLTYWPPDRIGTL